jgi:streptomycin 6-kinase
MFTPWLGRWALTPDGDPIQTRSSDLLPVRFRGTAAMLKVARTAEEQTGHRLMVWLDGGGAAQVYAHEGPALLMERLPGGDLTLLPPRGHDDEATRVLCSVAAHIHQPRPRPWPELTPLRVWFRSLEAAAPRGGLYARAWTQARALLDDPQDRRPLHGDLHHGNVRLGAGGEWRVIDPKGLLGERGFDYANIFCNPTLDFAAQPSRLARQATRAAELAGLDHRRLLAWITSYAALSAAWHLEDGDEAAAERTLGLAALAEHLG